MNDDELWKPDRVEALYQRLADTVRARMEGTIRRESEEDMCMFDTLFEDVLRNENVGLSRAERERLYLLLLNTL
ncbi:MAG: hypothetical protein IPM16_02070 [Chloroflexi bacterium]|nr:hypothetical protein [Chloroflexota bacterium]